MEKSERVLMRAQKPLSVLTVKLCFALQENVKPAERLKVFHAAAPTYAISARLLT